MMNYKINLIAIILLLTTACTGGRSHQTANDSVEADSIDFAYTVTLTHAEQMSIINKPSHKELYLLNPDSHDTLAAYAFYPQGKSIPQGLSPKMKPIAVPLKGIACSSTPQVGAIAALGGENELVAINTLNNVNSPKVRERIDKGLIQEIARGSSRNNELLLSLHPDVLLMDFSDQREQDDELRRAGIEPMLLTLGKKQAYLDEPNGSRLQAFYSVKISWLIAYTNIFVANTKPPKHSYATKPTQCRYCGAQIIKACGTYRANIVMLHACFTMLKLTLTTFRRRSIAHL